MEYRFNAERDRLDRFAWNPAFFKVTYLGKESERDMYLWACTANYKHLNTVAESFAKEDESIENVQLISKSQFMSWLAAGNQHMNPETGVVTIELCNEQIPMEHVLRFLIAEDQPGANPKEHKGKYGDLFPYRQSLQNKEEELISKIVSSFYKTQPECDIVRVAPDVVNDDKHLKQYQKQILKEDDEIQKNRVARLENTNLEEINEIER